MNPISGLTIGMRGKGWQFKGLESLPSAYSSPLLLSLIFLSSPLFFSLLIDNGYQYQVIQGGIIRTSVRVIM